MDNILNFLILYAFIYIIKFFFYRLDVNGILLGFIVVYIISILFVFIEDDKECLGFRFIILIRRICYCFSFY